MPEDSSVLLLGRQDNGGMVMVMDQFFDRSGRKAAVKGENTTKLVVLHIGQVVGTELTESQFF